MGLVWKRLKLKTSNLVNYNSYSFLKFDSQSKPTRVKHFNLIQIISLKISTCMRNDVLKIYYTSAILKTHRGRK